MMVSRGSRSTAVAGGPARHIPVLAGAAIEALAPRDGGIYVDATFGAGGHTRAILDAADCRVVGIDRDAGAQVRADDVGATAGDRFTFAQARFSALDDVVVERGHAQIDGILFDLGVSSMQLDDAARGFAFRLDGPLDMRMGDTGPNAADVIAFASERDLAAIIRTLGEERHARAVARAIVAERRREPILTTAALADIVSRVVRSRPGDIHPATRTFQALRMFVNEELPELAAALYAAERVLVPGGRLVVISFHSLEDRMVKTFLADRSRPAGVSRHVPEPARRPPSFRELTRRPVTPDEAEIAANPRARSAKLRAAERTDAPAGADIMDQLLPRLPSLAEVMRGS